MTGTQAKQEDVSLSDLTMAAPGFSNRLSQSTMEPLKGHAHGYNTDTDDDFDDSGSSSDYLSFDDSDDEDDSEEKARRERERQLVLEAAGLIVQQDVGPPPARSKRRPAPAAPTQRRPSGPKRVLSLHKDLPPVPSVSEPDTYDERPATPEPELSHEAQLDDAFARYESFKNTQANLNRLSVVSTTSSIEAPTVSSPSSSSVMTIPTSISSMAPSHVASGKPEADTGSKYSHFLHFLRSKTPDPEQPRRRRSASMLKISAPLMIHSQSNASSISNLPPSPTVPGHPATPDPSMRSNSPSFGTSWASLVDKTALEGIPPGERKRQEAIFELINTEIAFVRDLQLIVEVFYSSMMPLLSTKESTVIFANIEDILLVNTGFVSSLEERQKDCRLYVDKIGDILLSHIPNMGAYMEYCVNQATAIKVLQSLRENNPELATHLQRIRDENPAARNLDLSSYLLAPMQRITRYPLLIKQIMHYTEVGEELEANQTAQHMAEKLLEHINEAIRDQENHATLKRISQNLWIGQGRLDLTAPTRHMGPRKLIRQGYLFKTKSGRRLNAFLCSDILVLTDENVTTLYRMPIPLPHAQISRTAPDTFQISQPYPRGGDKLSLRAHNQKECQQWIQDISLAIKKSRHAEERAARKAAARR